MKMDDVGFESQHVPDVFLSPIYPGHFWGPPACCLMGMGDKEAGLRG